MCRLPRFSTFGEPGEIGPSSALSCRAPKANASGRRTCSALLAILGKPSAFRVWFVALPFMDAHQPGNGLDLPNLAVDSSLASLAGVSASFAAFKSHSFESCSRFRPNVGTA